MLQECKNTDTRISDNILVHGENQSLRLTKTISRTLEIASAKKLSMHVAIKVGTDGKVFRYITLNGGLPFMFGK